MKSLAAAALFFAVASLARAQDISRGVIVDNVKCATDPSQSYALYVPTTYSAERPSSILIAFHPAARGRAMVEKYQAAAEQYGYIVAGSNNSRNGPWAVSAAAVQAMSADLANRFAIDDKRIYVTGMSGGARLAFQIALTSGNVAGVIASSAGYPDSKPRESVSFAVFATAGTEDFNYIEMAQLDRKLKTPHFLAVFEGGHSLPPDAVAVEAIEWMELQAMQSGRRSRDEALIARLFEKRQRALAAAKTPADTVRQLESIAADFKGLHDVSAETARLAELSRDPDAKKAAAKARSDQDAEARMLGEIFTLETGLADPERRLQTLVRLRDRLSRLSRDANAPQPSPERDQARRVLRSLQAGAGERVQDAEYRQLLASYRLTQ